MISATAEYLLPDAPPEGREQLRGIVAETERISRLVHDLLSFARGGTPGRTAIALRGAVDRVLSLLRITLDRKHVQVTTEIPVDLPPIHADPDGLHQVLLNLLVNASQAVPEAGHIVIAARALEVEGERMVAFEVQDDGPGVAPGLQERIFDPFFTTRAEGTGLGLAVCARIVADHGGDLRVGQAAAGRRCLRGAAARQRGARVSGPDPARPGALRVLVVEDDPRLLDILTRHLDRHRLRDEGSPRRGGGAAGAGERRQPTWSSPMSACPGWTGGPSSGRSARATRSPRSSS